MDIFSTRPGRSNRTSYNAITHLLILRMSSISAGLTCKKQRRSCRTSMGLASWIGPRSDHCLAFCQPVRMHIFANQVEVCAKFVNFFLMYSPPGPAPARTTFQLTLFFCQKEEVCLQLYTTVSRSLFCQCWSGFVTMKLDFEQGVLSAKE